MPPTRFKFHPAPLHHPFGFMCCPSQVLVPRRALLRWRHLGRVVRWGGVGSPGRLRAAAGRSPEGVGCCFPMPRCPISPMEPWGHLCVHTCLPWPGLILGAPSPPRCSGVCSTSVPEGFTPERNQASQDKDIPAINQGETTGSYSQKSR